MSVSERGPTPEDYRNRYFELKRQAEQKNAERMTAVYRANPGTIPESDIVSDETIPPGWYWAGKVARGTTLRIVNEAGNANLSAIFWNADDPSERYNAGDTVKVQWTAQLSRGRLLLSDMGRVMASITDDKCGMHDFIAGGSTPASNLRKYGDAKVYGSDLRNTRDNFILAAGKHGLGPRDVGPCVTFFAPVSVDRAGQFVWRDDRCHCGDYVDLRAEMNLLVALSNCPHPLRPDKVWLTSPARSLIWRSPLPGVDDFCRTATEEAARAFQNTDMAFRQ